MSSVFADTSFYYALADSRDSRHPEATTLSKSVDANNLGLVSSWEIIVETVTLLRNRYSYQAAVNFIQKVLPSIQVIYIDDKIRQRSLSLFKKFASDKRLSLCDVISYILVKEHLQNIPCLAFDDDFEKLGLRCYH
ncbi:MAG: type II toxin-antitoxin system VapC family toxin [Deltaproteobacteria bacterium]|nr:type II toxin-antitoxin system VapC family toxin [Deltaproteobacteria bacterium]